MKAGATPRVRHYGSFSPRQFGGHKWWFFFPPPHLSTRIRPQLFNSSVWNRFKKKVERFRGKSHEGLTVVLFAGYQRPKCAKCLRDLWDKNGVRLKTLDGFNFSRAKLSIDLLATVYFYMRVNFLFFYSEWSFTLKLYLEHLDKWQKTKTRRLSKRWFVARYSCTERKWEALQFLNLMDQCGCLPTPPTWVRLTAELGRAGSKMSPSFCMQQRKKKQEAEI